MEATLKFLIAFIFVSYILSISVIIIFALGGIVFALYPELNDNNELTQFALGLMIIAVIVIIYIFFTTIYEISKKIQL